MSPSCAKATARATHMRCLKLSSELLQELLHELSARMAPMPENTATRKLSLTPSTDNKVAHQRRHLPPCIPAHESLQVAPDRDGKAIQARNNQAASNDKAHLFVDHRSIDNFCFALAALRLLLWHRAVRGYVAILATVKTQGRRLCLAAAFHTARFPTGFATLGHTHTPLQGQCQPHPPNKGTPWRIHDSWLLCGHSRHKWNMH